MYIDTHTQTHIYIYICICICIYIYIYTAVLFLLLHCRIYEGTSSIQGYSTPPDCRGQQTTMPVVL